MILVTGGAGYIGSHTVKALLKEGREVVVFDNLEQGPEDFIRDATLIVGDIRNSNDLKKLDNYQIDACLHFAAYASVGESVKDPSKYFKNNVVGSFNLIDYLNNRGVKKFVLSSTSEVYGEAQYLPIDESHQLNPTNPYGLSKLMVENQLSWFNKAYDFKYTALRYFNAAGASIDGSLGESHNPEYHLIPNAILGALGKKDFEFTFSKVTTPDGSPIRDFVHVEDLATAHILALRYLEGGGESDCFNLGTGKGYSVLEVASEVEKVTGVKLPQKFGTARSGEPAEKYASYQKAQKILGWNPKYGLADIIQSAYKWHKKLINLNTTDDQSA
ncbi:UDP-glucose 4-epimerase GalE [Candidatus Parcubacteria bacterium]|nr:UDP-glucose 4-epimerase GalE [Patescibacteria group bacterium]MBU4381012.1 UDP-glucose 4-epimerase GalE [Patescibacteria group bacterium]MCG2689323.1 UDP-glucose 4-epimerase GalE [Candidatus Parcubacteria bacterium]